MRTFTKGMACEHHTRTRTTSGSSSDVRARVVWGMHLRCCYVNTLPVHACNHRHHQRRSCPLSEVTQSKIIDGVFVHRAACSVPLHCSWVMPKCIALGEISEQGERPCWVWC